MDLRRSWGDESGHQVFLSIASALVSAVLEWMLMFMIFVDASFAYLVTRFARHYQLRTPCLLCSRLDHVLGDEGTDFHWDLICNEHKSKITSLVLCQLLNNHVDAPLSINRSRSGDVVQEITEKSSQLDQMWSRDADPLPHVEYSQIKDGSGSESEGPFSDTEHASGRIHGMETSDQESEAKFVSAEVARSPAPEKVIHPAPSTKSSLSESEKPTKSHHNVESEESIELGLDELNWLQGGHSKDVVGPSDLIDFSYVHPSPNLHGTHSIDSKQTNDATSTIELERDVHVDCRETSNLGIDSTSTNELSKEVITEPRENSSAGSNLVPPFEIQMDLKSNKIETSSQMTGPLDLGDAYKLALGARGRQLSGRLEQQRSITDRVSEDLKLLLSQISAARGVDLSSNDISPKVSANGEDFKAADAIGAQIFQRKISLERNESNFSLDGNSVCEVEGENDADILKRQVEHDKKILATLYKELEEERNASAIAANQAMAMITRLQEEKAAFHMEALQCVRVLEEQAEYDGEALQKANELLAENEKQIQRLQFELESYRYPFGDVHSSNNFVNDRPEYESDKLKERTLEADNRDTNALQISLRQFEDEKQYILERLKTVEEKLFMITKHEVYSDTIVRGFSKEEPLEDNTSDQPESVASFQDNGVTEQNHLKRDMLIAKDVSGYESAHHENGEQNVELSALRQELAVISNRLQALEAEQNVIECSINALDKGSEGFVFVREIATRLHELHSSHVMERKENSA
ncbi:myosin-binding protein 1-like [Salvia splendens]|nr:myosin-binding protein 1-like [Salvia splendens]XP_042062131.1 myosin-binding protein 1-like [Salvia splendens]XP_042062132.1 myosin-binding protein 1-like [Salvia splendens]XP_042062133.1 myosin-binding protein 1-like [Salvia splendens]XP_042062135.1 myosin-binding protein 1-like [Salvia splendens]